MTNFLTAAWAFHDSLLLQWFALLAAICAVIYVAGTAFFRWSEREVERHVTRALNPLPPFDAPDAVFEQWARDELGIVSDYTGDAA